MKVVNILFSQAVRLGKVSGAGGGSVYGINLTKACEERYGFLQGPRDLADYDLSKGVTFLHGYFGDRVVIDKFQVYANGLLAEAKVDTDDLEAFLDDVIKWVTERGGFQFEQDPAAPKIYESHLEVETNASLNAALSKFSPLGIQIADVLRGYKQVTPDWEVSGLSFGTARPADAASFRFERREGASVPHNVFFATSRMRTKDHLKILEEFEAML